jgi:hypothetical protein
MSSTSRSQVLIAKVLDAMNDGEPRTLRRIAYVTGVSVNTVRRAMNEGLLVKVGVRRLAPFGPRGQIVVQIAPAPAPAAVEDVACKRAAR